METKWAKPAPPSDFKPATSPLFAVESISPPRLRQRRENVTAARRRGLRYQRVVGEVLRKLFVDSTVLEIPWYRFHSDEDGARICSPDVVVITLGNVVVFEVKATHTELAWWQLNHLYRPVLEFLYERPVRCVEITRSYDPIIVMPGEFEVVFTLEDMMARLESPRASRGTLVVQWRPQRP